MKQTSTILYSLIFVLFSFVAQADTFISSKSLTIGSNTITIDLSIDTDTDLATVNVTGPSSVYFALGFGGVGSMSGTYAIIFDGSGLTQERKLGNHSQGTLLGQSISVSQNSVSGGVRSITFTRGITGLSADYFTFPTSATSFIVIGAIGGGASFGYHSGGRGISTMTTEEVLPIKLVDFSQQNINGDIKLSWHTASEINNEKFIVQRSRDNTTWINLDEIDGGGNSQSMLRYNYVDTKAEDGLNYYRLLQVDFDGTSTKSKVISAFIAPKNILDNVLVQPTVATNKITLEALQIITEATEVTVFNQNSSIVLSGVWPIGSSKNTLDINQLNSGLYFVRLSNAKNQKTYRFFKQ